LKSVLISIRPYWCGLIANGQKTIEVRKTRPKLETPFKCYIYCTQYLRNGVYLTPKALCGVGKAIAEFVCDEIYMLAPTNEAPEQVDVEAESCLTREQIVKYLRCKGYAWHISNLKIYDKPRELNNYTKYGYTDECPQQLGEIKNCKYNEWDIAEDSSTCAFVYDFRIDKCPYCRISKAPQSWCYVEEN